MSRHTSNTSSSSNGQIRTLLSGVFGFMNKPLMSTKNKDVKPIRKSNQVAIIQDEYELLEADSYMVDEISHEDFETCHAEAAEKGRM